MQLTAGARRHQRDVVAFLDTACQQTLNHIRESLSLSPGSAVGTGQPTLAYYLRAAGRNLCALVYSVHRLEAIMIRILIADDHETIRHGLRDLLERHEGWEVCAEASKAGGPLNSQSNCVPRWQCLIYRCLR